MDSFVPPGRIRTHLLRRIPKHGLCVFTPNELIRLRVPFPNDVFRCLGSQAITRFAGLQFCLNPFALCNITIVHHNRVYAWLMHQVSRDRFHPAPCAIGMAQTEDAALAAAWLLEKFQKELTGPPKIVGMHQLEYVVTYKLAWCIIQDKERP